MIYNPILRTLAWFEMILYFTTRFDSYRNTFASNFMESKAYYTLHESSLLVTLGLLSLIYLVGYYWAKYKHDIKRFLKP